MIVLGCSTPFGINARITLDLAALQIQAVMCSTPFGINARITRALSEPVLHAPPVLNAFRHQREDHVLEVHFGKNYCYQCSTRFGINARITKESI